MCLLRWAGQQSSRRAALYLQQHFGGHKANVLIHNRQQCIICNCGFILNQEGFALPIKESVTPTIYKKLDTPCHEILKMENLTASSDTASHQSRFVFGRRCFVLQSSHMFVSSRLGATRFTRAYLLDVGYFDELVDPIVNSPKQHIHLCLSSGIRSVSICE